MCRERLNATIKAPAAAPSPEQDHEVGRLYTQWVALATPAAPAVYFAAMGSDPSGTANDGVVPDLAASCAVALGLERERNGISFPPMLDLFRHMCRLGAQTIGGRIDTLRRARMRIEQWALRGEALAEQNQKLKEFQELAKNKLAETKEEKYNHELAKRDVLAKYAAINKELKQEKEMRASRQRSLEQQMEPARRAHELACGAVHELKDAHLETLCSLCFGSATGG
ncbi:unnamed protein product, partial [Chrysoparadoxa australica]